MAKENEKLTSVKVDVDIFEKFKIECIKRKYSIHNLVNTAMKLYIEDDDFRRKLTNFK